MRRGLGIRSAPARLRDERGVALLIVLVIVALLTITVTEFTFSAQIDAHRTRNAVHALQSELIARSGINIMQGFVIADRDEEPLRGVTWKGEDWWVELCDFCRSLQLDETTLVRCQVDDESGKININDTRPGANWVLGQKTKDALLREVLRVLFNARNLDPEIIDRLLTDYWQQEPPQRADGRLAQVPEFETVDDFADWAGISPQERRPLYKILTARRSMPGRPVQININTAREDVISTILTPSLGESPPPAFAELMEKRASEPLLKADIESLSAQTGDPETDFPWAVKRSLLGTDSNIYRLESSSLSNVDPDNPDSGGIGQTLSVVVERRKRAAPSGRQGAAGDEAPIWTLKLLDWQKEGGARLFHEPNYCDEMDAEGDEATEEQTPIGY